MSTTPRMTFIGMFNYDNHLFDNLTLPTGVDKDTSVLTFLMQYGECPVLYTDVDFVKAALRVWSLKNEEPISRIFTALSAEYNPIHNFDRYEETSDSEQSSETTDYTGSETDGHTGSETTGYTGSETDGHSGSEVISYTGSETTESSMSESTSETTSETQENQVSAFNASTYQPSTKTTTNADSEREMERGQEDTHTRNLTDTHTLNLTDTHTRNLTDTHTQNLTDTHTRNLKDVNKGNRESEHWGHLYGNIGVTRTQEMIRDEIDLRETYSIYEIVANMLYRDFCLYTY